MSNKPTSIMIDIESLSKKKTAVIVSIGACKFNDKEITDKFYINIDPLSCKEAGLHIQKDTIDWWKQQKPEAYAALKNNRHTLSEALTAFNEFFGKDKLDVWANSPSFDCVILENAYEVTGIVKPWMFYQEMCFRTFKRLFSSDKKLLGTQHDALADAIYQTQYVLDVLNRK